MFAAKLTDSAGFSKLWEELIDFAIAVIVLAVTEFAGLVLGSAL